MSFPLGCMTNIRAVHAPYSIEFPTLTAVKSRRVDLPREVTHVTNEEEVEEDRTAAAIHYSIDVETRNYNLSDAERTAIRNMMRLMVGEMKAKIQFVLDDPNRDATVRAYVSSSSSGRRELHPAEE
jgi:hypothetical protein